MRERDIRSFSLLMRLGLVIVSPFPDSRASCAVVLAMLVVIVDEQRGF